jgi:hypothetical protein
LAANVFVPMLQRCSPSPTPKLLRSALSTNSARELAHLLFQAELLAPLGFDQVLRLGQCKIIHR